MRRKLSPLRRHLSLHLDYVSASRSSNRACGFPARASRSRSCLRSRAATITLPQAYQAVVHPQHSPPGSARASRTAPCASGFPQQGSPRMEGSATTQGLTPQAPTEPDISAWSNNSLRTEEKIGGSALGAPDRRRTAPDRAQGTTPSVGVRSAAWLGGLRSRLRWRLRRDVCGPTIPRRQSGSNAA